MDDETYFDVGGHDFFGGRYFSQLEGEENVPDNVKYREKSKFGAKLMLWLAISPKGKSGPYFMTCRGAMNSERYIRECLEKRLLPFINQHSQRKYIFWPDLASSHYSAVSQTFMK
jgi:hypothetical protein